MATTPPPTLRTTARPAGAAEPGAGQPVSARATTTDAPVTAQAHVGGTQADGHQREQRAHGEGEHRGPGRVPGVGQLVGVDAQLGLGVRAEGVVRGQLLGHLEGEVAGVRPFCT